LFQKKKFAPQDDLAVPNSHHAWLQQAEERERGPYEFIHTAPGITSEFSKRERVTRPNASKPHSAAQEVRIDVSDLEDQLSNRLSGR
jgi:hypothetical protein